MRLGVRTMVNPADFRHSDNPAQFRRFNRSSIWTVLPKRKMTRWFRYLLLVDRLHLLLVRELISDLEPTGISRVKI